MKIAVPIPIHSVNSAVELIRRANRIADLIELRLDYSKILSEKDLKRLIDACKKPVIATNRLKKEGGNFKGKESDRIYSLQKAIDFGADYIDIELNSKSESIKKILKKIHDNRNKTWSKLIISYHNLKKTPRLDDLKKLFKKMSALKPDVVKIVCKANDAKDNESMILLIEEAKKANIEIIAFCTGGKGKYSRMHSCDFGACITFGSLEKGIETAEGQLTVGEMKGFTEEFG